MSDNNKKLKNINFNLRINEEMLEQVKQAAKAQGVTTSNYIINCIQKEFLEDSVTNMLKSNKEFQNIVLEEFKKMFQEGQ